MRKRWKKNLGENPLNLGGLVELGNGFKKWLIGPLFHKGRVINLSNFCQQIKVAAHTQWTNESACIFYFEIYQPSLLIFNGLPKFLMINNFNSLNQDCLDSSFFSSKSLIFKIKNQWHSNYIRNKICNFY